MMGVALDTVSGIGRIAQNVAHSKAPGCENWRGRELSGLKPQLQEDEVLYYLLCYGTYRKPRNLFTITQKSDNEW